MIASAQRAINAYAKIGIETGVQAADPHRLVLMLFEGARLAITEAKLHMQRKETAAKGAAITKAIMIVEQGLKASLDVEAGGEMAEKLHALYDYMASRLLIANIKNEPRALDEVGRLLAELNGAWETIGKSNAATAPAAPAQRKPTLRLGREKA